MKTLIVAAALALAPLAASADTMSTPAAAAPDMSGACKIDAAFGDAIKYTLTCTLKQDGQKLSRPCSTSMCGEPIATTGAVAGGGAAAEAIRQPVGRAVPPLGHHARSRGRVVRPRQQRP